MSCICVQFFCTYTRQTASLHHKLCVWIVWMDDPKGPKVIKAESRYGYGSTHSLAAATAAHMLHCLVNRGCNYQKKLDCIGENELMSREVRRKLASIMYHVGGGGLLLGLPKRGQVAALLACACPEEGRRQRGRVHCYLTALR